LTLCPWASAALDGKLARTIEFIRLLDVLFEHAFVLS
jgi:hypothetical protein